VRPNGPTDPSTWAVGFVWGFIYTFICPAPCRQIICAANTSRASNSVCASLLPPLARDQPRGELHLSTPSARTRQTSGRTARRQEVRKPICNPHYRSGFAWQVRAPSSVRPCLVPAGFNIRHSAMSNLLYVVKNCPNFD
jgi:hypothetical protein